MVGLRALRFVTAIPLVIVGALATGCAHKNITAAEARLSNVAQPAPTWSAEASTSRLSGVSVSDGRSSDQRTGRRIAEKDGSEAPITFASDLEAWVGRGVRDELSTAGVAFDPGANRALVVRIERLELVENVAFQAGYDGTIALGFEIVDASGRAVWSQRGTGSAKNWGRPASAANYSETLSHALARAVTSAFDSPDAQRALAGR